MSRRTVALEFDAIYIEGGLLPAEWLGNIAALKAAHQSLADYGSPKGLNLRDELGRYWRIAKAHWSEFDNARARAAAPHALTTRFVQALLSEVFGATDLQPQAASQVISERQYPVTAIACGGRLPLVVATTGQRLDERDRRYGDGNRLRSAFGLLQDWLNASDTALWGIASNGLQLRLARDNASLTRPAWIEADLERIFTEERYADFSLLWLLIHASRFGNPGNLPQQCPLEAWREGSKEQGTRAREQLRQGVEEALAALGQGFLTETANQTLRDALASGTLGRNAYFQQLLRLVYRLIFLLTIEERGLLHAANSDAEAVKLYAGGYSLRRLRARARKRRAFDRHADLWDGLRPVFIGLAHGQPLLALPALGGLFAEDQCPDLDACTLGNAALLEAVARLGWMRAGHGLTRINWRDMGPEELGSVYESLLELVPDISADGRMFRFANAESSKGNARKTSGSYYTPDSLVQELLDSALEPVIQQSISGANDPEVALLSITVCDPACGSGHFLLGAARRLATRLAQLRAHGTPTGDDFRHALRDVISRCLYGVDRNPMAVELCKVALWLEAIEPGRPLGYLDAHIRCGDALIGVHSLSVLTEGIPDEAFSPLKDVLADSKFKGVLVDDKDSAKALRRRNAGEKRAPLFSLSGLNLTIPDELNTALEALGSEENTLADVEAKRHLYEQARADGTLTWRLLTACDLWVASFFSVKRLVSHFGAETTPTSDVVWRFLADPGSLHERVAEEVADLRKQYRFFHWPLEFPEVFQRGGFSLLLGNPPWETMSPDAKEYFAKHEPAIAGMPPEVQKQRIAGLLDVAAIVQDWESHARTLYAAVRFIKESGRYRLFAEGNLGKGDFNVYRQFVELALAFTARGGVAAQIVPENFYNGANASAIRAELFQNFRIAALYGFENARETWFKGIDTRMKFALYVAFRGLPTEHLPASFSLNSLQALQEVSARGLSIPLELVREFSPDALAVMEFSNQLEINIARDMYGRFPRLGEELKGFPSWIPVAELHMGNDNSSFSFDPTGIPLYQGSMVTHHDYRAKGYVAGHGRNVIWRDLAFGSPDKAIVPQWRVLEDQIPIKISGRIRRYRIGFCDVGNSTNQRALMAALIPPNTVCGHKVPTIEFEPLAPAVMMLWLAVANSLAMDFIVRMKVALTMSISLLATLPFPRTVVAGDTSARAAALATRLSCTGAEMEGMRARLAELPELVGQDLTPCDDPLERARLMAELDVVVARDLYGLDRQQMAYLLEPRDVLGQGCTAETFSALRRAEEREFHEYRTKRLVLEAWDALEAQSTITIASPKPARRTAARPAYAQGATPASVAEEWLAGLVCDVFLQAGPLDDTQLQRILTTQVPSDTPHAEDLTEWLAPVEGGRLPQVLGWLRTLLGAPLTAPLSLRNPQALGEVIGDHRTESLARALVEARRQRDAQVGEVMTEAAPATESDNLRQSG